MKDEHGTDPASLPLDGNGDPVRPGEEAADQRGDEPREACEPPDPPPEKGWQPPEYPGDGNGVSGEVVKFSPTGLRRLLRCPRKFYYYAVEHLESVSISSKFAFGRAVHAAIEAAVAHKNAPMTADEVADVFEKTLRFHDERGIAYKEGESLDGCTVMRKSRKKGVDEEPVEVPGLVAQGRPLVKLWYETFGEEILGSKILLVEAEIKCDVDLGLVAHGYPDLIREKDGLVWLTNHKTAAGWGDSDEEYMPDDPQLTFEAYLCWKKLGRVPDVISKDVLKKTKAPVVLRSMTTRTEDDLVAFEQLLRDGAEIARFYLGNGIFPQNFTADCTWSCEFCALCKGLEGAEEMFATREKRKQQTAAAAAA